MAVATQGPRGAGPGGERLGDLRRHAPARLPASDSARLDVDLLLAHVLGCDRVQLLAHPERTLDAGEAAAFEALLARRATGEPVAYLLGYKGFANLVLAVTPAVLVPRPDTETLVDAVLERCDARARTVLDLGTGSGAIALALADRRGDWLLLATDRSRAALDVAWDNSLRSEIFNVRFVQADWTAAFGAGCADVIVSNPPYVGTGDAIDEALRFEPADALFAGEDGLADIRRIVTDAPRVLRPGGWLAIEHGASQGEAVRALFAAAGMDDVTTEHDLVGHERATCGRRPGGSRT
jgi:release factor glutamine methyltransferase